LLTGIDGVEFAACWARRERVCFGGLMLNLIGLDDFKTDKRAAWRLLAAVLAAAAGMEGPRVALVSLVTRDPPGYSSYFPSLKLIAQR
jgi:hypothetical protein